MKLVIQIPAWNEEEHLPVALEALPREVQGFAEVEVVVIDDLSTGSLANLNGVMDHPQFEFVLDDVRNAESMHLLVERCDVVFHLAAAVGVQLIVDQPVHTIETNIHGSEVVLAIANKFRKKVLIASTSEVYGKSENLPFREDDDTVLGSTRFSRWSYACSKAIDEFLRRGGKALVVVASAVNLKPQDASMQASLNLHNLDKLLVGYGINMKKNAVLDFGAQFRIPILTASGKVSAIRHPGLLIL